MSAGGASGSNPWSSLSPWRGTVDDMAFKLDKSNVEAEMLVRHDATFVSERATVHDLVSRAQRAETPEEYVDVHARLLASYAARQSVREARRKHRRREKETLADLARRRPFPLDDIRHVQRRNTTRQEQDLRDAVLLHALRRITDAVVWRLLAFDRRALTVLGDGQRVDRLALGPGFDEELRVIDALWRGRGAVAIHNDLASCLRHGDVTVFHPPLPPDEVQIAEVKVPGQRAGHTNQRERLEHGLTTLRTGRGLIHGHHVLLRRLPIRYRTHLDVLAATVARARAVGYAEVCPEAGMLVVAVDLDRYHDPESELGDWMLEPPARRGWTPRDDRHFGSSALAAALRDRHLNSSYLAPLPLFPLPADDITDILLGTVDYVVTLRADAIESAFERQGIAVQVAGGDEANRTFLQAERGDFSVTVGAQVREQMLRELMTTDCLVDMVAALLDDVQAGASVDEQRMLFCDERAAWPRAPVLLTP